MSYDLSEARARLRPGQELARVSASQGNRARVLLDGVEMEAAVAGAVSYLAADAAALPATGDWVVARRVEPHLALIEEVLPRRSKIARRAAGRRDDQQVLAANVDFALIVCGLDADFNLRRLERYLVIASQGDVEPVVLLNKADLAGGVCPAVEEARNTLGSARVLAVSARTGFGCEAVEAMLGPGVTAVLLGSSGAGKSTLLNRLSGAGQRRTAPVRESDSRGRHTTTARELVELPSGAAVIDTPGLREIQLWADPESIAEAFDDISDLAAMCRFRDCTHTSEPGCAVRGAVDPGRLGNFHKLQREADRINGRLTEKQRWRVLHKAARQIYKLKGKQ